MFSEFQTNGKMSKEDYDKELLEIRTELIKTQYLFKEYKRPIFAGTDRA